MDNSLESRLHAIAMKYFQAGVEWAKVNTGEAEFSQLIKDAGERLYREEQEKAEEEYAKWR